MKKSPYSLILAIDLNNTSDSFVYKKINDLYSDSYSQNGFNFGSTYDFSFLPIRIDYVFYSKLIKMNLFEIKIFSSIPLKVLLSQILVKFVLTYTFNNIFV